MKERPILFQGAMVRALLDGMKTQTRRIIKVQPPEDEPIRAGFYHPTVTDKHGQENPGDEVFGAYTSDGEWAMKCPYGAPGDRLYVRETFWQPHDKTETLFRADGAVLGCGKWTPSIHMPRRASRILLEVVSVRVERLQDISAADARAEGLHRYEHDWRDCEYPLDNVAYEPFAGFGTRYSSPAQAYRALWEHINGAGSWDANPWLWVVTFRRVQP